MYHCHIHFHLIGHDRALLDAIRGAQPLERFTHSFSESSGPDAALTARADVILADVRGMDAGAALEAVLRTKADQAEVVAVAGREQIPQLADCLPRLRDLWPAPMGEAEAHFRFRRWQEGFRQAKDLWETAHYLDATIDSIPTLIWYKDKNGIHEKVNDCFCRTVKKTKEQVQGRGHAYIWDVDRDDPACIESEREVMETRQTCVSEETIQTGEGERLLTTYKSPLYDVDGSVMGTVGVGIDVTRERAFQDELVRKNQTLEALFTTMDCGVLSHSADGKIRSINRAALEILGYSSQEELAAGGFDIIAPSVVPEDQERLLACIRSLKNDGDSIGLAYRVRHANGDVRDIMGNVKLTMEAGVPVYQRFLLDCTAQKEREQQERLEQDRRQMELIQALSMDYSLVCFFDLDTGLGTPLRGAEGAAGSFAALFAAGRPFQESIDDYTEQYVWPEDRETFRRTFSQERLREELSEKPAFYMNYRVMSGGEAAYYEIKAVRAGTWDGRRGMVLGFKNVDDVTRNELEQKALLEDALSQANRANRAKNTFLSNMSHDMRTPLNAIFGFNTLARRDCRDPESVRSYLDRTETAAHQLLGLIDKVLDLSQAESGQLLPVETEFDLDQVLEEVYGFLQPQAEEKDIDFTLDCGGVEHREICGDREKLKQLVMYLTNNAVTYTHPGGRVSIRVAEREALPNGYALYQIVVQDTGIGIGREFLSRLFDPFAREKNTTLSGIHGIGLGLTIVKNIVDMMGGSIDVDSALGKGSTFTVTLRLRVQPRDCPAPQDDAGLALKPGGAAILLVEDNEINLEIETAVLEDLGYTVDTAVNGSIAVEKVKNAPPGTYGLVLMDIQMPVMDGWQASEAIRRLNDPAAAGIPIIALSANVFDSDMRRSEESGMDAHLPKPLDVAQLLKTIETVTAKRRSGALI